MVIVINGNMGKFVINTVSADGPAWKTLAGHHSDDRVHTRAKVLHYHYYCYCFCCWWWYYLMCDSFMLC